MREYVSILAIYCTFCLSIGTTDLTTTHLEQSKPTVLAAAVQKSMHRINVLHGSLQVDHKAMLLLKGLKFFTFST